MKSKYQIKSKEGVVTFTKKDDFLKRCRLEFSTNKKGNIQYSFDYGNKWNSILNFPNDRQTIESQKKPQVENQNYSKKGESTLEQSSGDSNWFSYLIVIALIIGGVYYFTSNNNQNKVPRTENNQETITPMDSSIDVNLGEPIPYPEPPENNFSITFEAEQLFIDNPIFEIIKIDYDTKNTLLQILSDPNPNPDNIENQSCDNTNTRCIYCNNKVMGVYYTHQKYLYKVLSCEPNTVALNGYCFYARMAFAYGDMGKSSEQNNESKVDEENDLEKIDLGKVMSYPYIEKVLELEPIITDICSNYKNGIKYICVEEPVTDGSKNFCSEKCKTEYKYSH
jgi:hypothetical protein